MKSHPLFRKSILMLALALVFCTGVSAQEYVGPRTNSYNDPSDGIYVSPNGNDATATGAIDAPYKSINTALAVANPGNTIILRNGVYHEYASVRIRKPNITIKSAKGEWAVIDLPLEHDPDVNWHQSSAIRFDVDGEGSSGGKLQSLEVTGGFYAVSLETKWDWGQPDNSGASHITIEDCKLHDSRNDVVKVKPNCRNVTICYNEIYNSGREHIDKPNFPTGQENSGGIDNVNGANMHVHHNYIHDICSTGVYAKGGATDAVIEDNRIERTYAAGIMIGFDTSPEFFDLTVNPKYYENINGTVRNNLIINTGWAGIGLYASKDAQVYNNTVVDAVIYGAGNFNSPIFFGVANQDWENPDGCPPNINPNIHHNLINQPSSYKNRMIDIRYVKDFYDPELFPDLPSYDLSALEGMPTMNNNCYYLAGGSARFTDNRPNSLLDNGGLDAWKTHINGDNNSIETDPALNANYMPTNTQCTEMGIPYPLLINNWTGIDIPANLTSGIRVYPNPTTGELHIGYEICDNRICDIEIYDIMGRSVRTYRIRPNDNETETTINVSHLPSGVYFIKIENKTVKFVKK